MERLEINVNDSIKVSDSLKKTILIIVEEFKKWMESKDEKPFSLTVKRASNKSPPPLEINVSEEVKTKTAFGS